MPDREVVRYALEDGTEVSFEIEPPPGYRPASADKLAGKVREAVQPAVRAAQEVLIRVKESGPAEVQVKFGIKVGGGASWWIAHASGESAFEVSLTWKPEADQGRSSGPESL
jgi:hypothetical protein